MLRSWLTPPVAVASPIAPVSGPVTSLPLITIEMALFSKNTPHAASASISITGATTVLFAMRLIHHPARPSWPDMHHGILLMICVI
jgi:hypothetical protein